MRRLGDASFFRLFDRIVSSKNPGHKLDSFVVDGVTWLHERHGFSGQAYSFSLEVFTGSCAGRQSWGLTVVKEYWWKGDRSKIAKNTQWAVLDSGRRADVIAWFQKQEKNFI
jgi:hypothetical protein